MGGLLVGFALGAMAFTERGREIGNQIGVSAVSAAKKMIGLPRKELKRVRRMLAEYGLSRVGYVVYPAS